jgi:transcriptional regulator with XRE-family HTH domain
MSVTASALGDFLRARREQLHPEDVGLNSGPRRRVPGLRREELAMLAGISVDYYLRLEQGRDEHPSAQILDALARALRLDVKATEHLHRLSLSAFLTFFRRWRSTPREKRPLLATMVGGPPAVDWTLSGVPAAIGDNRRITSAHGLQEWSCP